MNIKEVKDLIHEILASDISEFELEHTGTKVKLRRGFQSEPALPVTAPTHYNSSSAQAVIARVEPLPPAGAGEEAGEDADLHIITSPIVGTFYRASSPGSEPFVKVGDIVDEGKTLCIVEAMKLMNEIPSDVAGEVVRIFVDNSHPVEFGQKLFGIRTRN